MGLILSVLVACVGLCELFAFYSKVRANLIFPSPRGDLTTISDGYIQELRGLRKDIATNSQKTVNEVDNVAINILNLRLNSHEDVKKISNSPSRSKLPVTDKKIEIPRHSLQSLRHCVVSDNLPTLEKSQSQTSLPEVLIEEGKNLLESLVDSTYVLQERNGISEISKSPSPKQLVVSEDELNTIVFKETYFQTLPQRERTLSPSPPLDLPQVPRNNVCNELSSIGGVCIDNNKSRSPTPSGNVDVILESTSYNTTQYWTNKVLVVPGRKSRSRSSSPNSQNTIDSKGRNCTFLEAPKHIRVRSKSESDDYIVNTPLNSTSKATSNLGLSDEFEWSFPLQLEEEVPSFGNCSDFLENVNNTKSAQKSVSDANTVRRNATETENKNSEVQDLIKSEKTIDVSTHAAEEPRKVSSEDKSSTNVGTEPSDSKHGEPFWVKN